MRTLLLVMPIENDRQADQLYDLRIDLFLISSSKL